MLELESLIRYESECSFLDFKATQYKREQHQAFLKDVISMANANISGDKYIVIGVKINGNGNREFLGLTEPMIDSAIYQQLINENIEPELTINYSSVNIDDKSLAIFIISGCDNQPYMMKKDYGDLKRGNAFIRRGSFQTPLLRSDFDRIYENKNDKSFFSGELLVVFTDSNRQELAISVRPGKLLPSDVAAERIKAEIKRKNSPTVPGHIQYIQDMMNSNLNDNNYKTIPELEAELSRIKETYIMEDLYDKFENQATKVNLTIYNKGIEYVKDASIEVNFSVQTGIEIAGYVPKKPNSFGVASFMETYEFHQRTSYPIVIQKDGAYQISQFIGDLKHHIPIDAFVSPLRMYLSQEVRSGDIPVKCRVLGENIKRPIEQDLILRIQNG